MGTSSPNLPSFFEATELPRSGESLIVFVATLQDLGGLSRMYFQGMNIRQDKIIIYFICESIIYFSL